MERAEGKVEIRDGWRHVVIMRHDPYAQHWVGVRRRRHVSSEENPDSQREREREMSRGMKRQIRKEDGRRVDSLIFVAVRVASL